MDPVGCTASPARGIFYHPRFLAGKRDLASESFPVPTRRISIDPDPHANPIREQRSGGRVIHQVDLGGISLI